MVEARERYSDIGNDAIVFEEIMDHSRPIDEILEAGVYRLIHFVIP